MNAPGVDLATLRSATSLLDLFGLTDGTCNPFRTNTYVLWNKLLGINEGSLLRLKHKYGQNTHNDATEMYAQSQLFVEDTSY